MSRRKAFATAHQQRFTVQVERCCRTTAIGIGVAFIAGCTDAVEPAQIAVATLYNGSDIPAFVVPDTVNAKAPFEVVVYPQLDCGWQPAQALVQVNGNVAIVQPRVTLNARPRSTPLPCPGQGYRRSVGLVTFDAPGHASVRINARSGTSGRDTVVVVPVVVR